MKRPTVFTKVSDTLYACHIDSSIWLLQRKNLPIDKKEHFYEIGCVEQMDAHTGYQCFSISVLKNTSNGSIEALRLLYPAMLYPDKQPNVINDEGEILEKFNEMLYDKLHDISRA